VPEFCRRTRTPGSLLANPQGERIAASNIDLRHNAAMRMPDPYLSETQAPTRDEMDARAGLTLLEFGTDWCGYCRGAQAAIGESLSQQPQWHHVKVEDGPGRKLGRSYSVKRWPTLVLLRDGQEVARLVRPSHAADILAALNAAKSDTKSAE
jgi:thioredoxin 1